MIYRSQDLIEVTSLDGQRRFGSSWIQCNFDKSRLLLLFRPHLIRQTLHSECGIWKIKCSVVDRGNCKSNSSNHTKNFFSTLSWNGLTKLDTLAILELKNNDISPIKEKFFRSKLLCFKLSLEGLPLITVNDILNVGIDILNSLDTSWSTFKCRLVDLLIKVLEVLDCQYNSTWS